MYISDLFKQKKPVISFEIFPPKKDGDPGTIIRTIEELAAEKPDFISVTYSAGGTGNSGMTIEIASMIKNKFGIEALAHLTCINADTDQIHHIIKALKAHNIDNILALRGDTPAGAAEIASDYRYASDLIREIKEYRGFSIGAAAYPEGHLEAADLTADLTNLAKKVEAGADFLITQLFFDNRLFYEFMEQKSRYGIKVPVSVGVMPVLSKHQIEKMIFMCGASLPSRIIRLLNRYEKDPDSLRKAGIEYAAEQIRDLIENGVEGIHIYTMNQPDIAKNILGYIR